MCANGTYEVKLNFQPSSDASADATLGRLAIDQQFQGDLEAASKGGI